MEGWILVGASGCERVQNEAVCACVDVWLGRSVSGFVYVKAAASVWVTTTVCVGTDVCRGHFYCCERAWWPHWYSEVL